MHNINNESKNIISKKKEFYKVNAELLGYLQQFSRHIELPVQYQDLKRYAFSTPLKDKEDNDTLWETVYYNDVDRAEIYNALTTIYVILKAASTLKLTEFLHIERVDYCTFGNSNPFRVKVVNNFNDNYDYFYVKVADASRIYGLELEHILSPNRISYLVFGNSLVEEHIAGIPGDIFITNYHQTENFNETRIAKEFVKFNERCFVKLLGDMRAYNFVMDMTPDFDDVQYRIRAIDFDQQCYEGRKNLYLPQFFKDNLPYVEICKKHMNHQNLAQYQREERALISNRIKTSSPRLKALLDVMVKDTISTRDKLVQLRKELARFYKHDAFLKCETMGQVVKNSLEVVLK